MAQSSSFSPLGETVKLSSENFPLPSQSPSSVETGQLSGRTTCQLGFPLATTPLAAKTAQVSSTPLSTSVDSSFLPQVDSSQQMSETRKLDFPLKANSPAEQPATKAESASIPILATPSEKASQEGVDLNPLNQGVANNDNSQVPENRNVRVARFIEGKNQIEINERASGAPLKPNECFFGDKMGFAGSEEFMNKYGSQLSAATVKYASSIPKEEEERFQSYFSNNSIDCVVLDSQQLEQMNAPVEEKITIESSSVGTGVEEIRSRPLLREKSTKLDDQQPSIAEKKLKNSEDKRFVLTRGAFSLKLDEGKNAEKRRKTNEENEKSKFENELKTSKDEQLEKMEAKIKQDREKEMHKSQVKV